MNDTEYKNGQIVKHNLDDRRGIIVHKGMKTNSGQKWIIRFERDNYYEEIECHIWEFRPE